VFIASTNLMDGLDRAALRRFDYKIRVDYLRPAQSQRMLERLLDDWTLPRLDEESAARLARMTRLTPGDFALVRRRHAIAPFTDARAVLDALRQEVEMKKDESRPIGFM
jgi:SpoVK/Ycf46/Vps4 family AAA+-type ATPase